MPYVVADLVWCLKIIALTFEFVACFCLDLWGQEQLRKKLVVMAIDLILGPWLL
jgi:hypothetical protein